MGEIPQLIQEPVLRDRVYETLESLILGRVLEPGQRLVEVELAERLGVSRNPVREALGMLARDGWVEVRPRSGTYVREPSPKEITDFFEVRTALEALMGREAARKADGAAIREFREIWRRGSAAVEAGDIPGIVRANGDFHRLVLAVADNVVLAETARMMRKRLRWYFSHIAGLRGGRSWDEHLPIVEAIERGDEDEAARLMAEHSRHVEATYRGDPAE